MKHRSRSLIAGLAVGAVVLSCDEGRLLTEVETQPFTASIEGPTGADTIYVGAETEYHAVVKIEEDTVTTDVVHWEADPAGILAHDTAHHGSSHPVTAIAPGEVTLTARARHPALEEDERSIDIVVLLSRVEGVAPASGDTTVTAVGDAITVEARGIGAGSSVADSAGLTWDHRGSAFATVTPLDRDTLRLEALQPGTDTLIVRQQDDYCLGGPCADTILVRVAPTAARIEATDTLSFDALATVQSLAATVWDSNENPIPGAAVTWALTSGTAATVNAAGEVTAVENGEAEMTATSGSVSDIAVVVVSQAVDTLTADSASITFTALQAEKSAVVTARDPARSIVTRGYDVVWTTSAAGVAVVLEDEADDRQATITAVGVGSAAIIATAEGKADTIAVTVGQAVDSIAIITPRDTLTALGQTTQLSAQPLDANGQPASGTITWADLDPAAATINGSGLVTAVANGTARFTAVTAGVEDTITLTVHQVAETVTIAPDPVPDTLLAGDTEQLTVAATDSLGNAIASPSVTWASTDVSVVTVNGSGLVTGQAVTGLDSAKVVATAGPTADTVWVFADVATIQAVVVSPENETIEALGATITLTAQGLNQNGNPIPDEEFTWLSLDGGVATVNASGVVTAQSNGSAEIEVTSVSNTALKDTATVVVSQKVATVTISPTSHTFNALTHTKQFSATARDSEGATITGASFVWTDDAAASGIISVDGTGMATADDVGTTKVIVTASGVADSADITVQQVPASISTTPARDTVSVGGTAQLTATVRDSAAQTISSGSSVTWTSFNTDFATVDASGLVTGVGASGTDSVAIQAQATGFNLIRDTTYITVAAYVLEFDGDDYGDAGDVLPLSTSAWTIELWVKPTNTTGTQFLLSRGGTCGDNGSGYGVYLDAGAPSIFVRESTGGGACPSSRATILPSNTILSTTNWSHVAVSYDGAKLRMYINGAPSDSLATALLPQNVAANLIFGASDAAAANAFTGKLDEVRFWSTTRTAAQIAGTYQATLTGSESNLLGWWPFDAGTGNPVDQRGGITLTLGAPTADPAWVPESPSIP